MRLLQLLPLAAAATAIVLPDDQVIANVAVEDHHEHAPQNLEGHFLEDLHDTFNELRDRIDDAIDSAKYFFDEVIDSAAKTAPEVVEKIYSDAYDVNSWLSGDFFNDQPMIDFFADEPPQEGPPEDGPPEDEPPHHGPPHGPPPHGPPPHGPPHGSPPHGPPPGPPPYGPPHGPPPHGPPPGPPPYGAPPGPPPYGPPHGPPPYGPPHGPPLYGPPHGPPPYGPPHGPPPHGPPPHGPPHGPPPHGPPHGKPPHHGPPHHPPHHGHHKSNLTIYQLISKSKYTTKLAKLIDEDEELVQLLNSTTHNYTVFAPTDAAFEKIPKHAPKPSKEIIKAVLLYHIAPSLYPAQRLLVSHTIPTLHNSTALGKLPQRLNVRVGLRGLHLNFYSKVVAANIFTENGVIHGVDSIILPPPKVLSIIGLLPGEFSTLSLGLAKTGLLTELNETAHAGSTFFAPSNLAFKKLGPRINAFLFSKAGERYLKALIKYHVVHNATLYSNAYYNTSNLSGEGEVTNLSPPKDPLYHQGPMGPKERLDEPNDGPEKGKPRRPHRPHPPPRAHFHYDLPTLLHDLPVSVDINRVGPFIGISVNRFARVLVADGVARDGVIHVVSNVLIPKKPGGKDGEESQFWEGEVMSVEDFQQRLEPYLANEEDDERLEM